jgi:hypothetical protein
MNFYPANELFEIKVQDNQAFPLNLEFKKTFFSKETFETPGIFFLTYREELIYIGHADQQDAIERIKRQLETITLRGNHIGFNELSKQTIEQSKILNSHFSSSVLEKSTSYMTSEKRILFTENHWNDFSILDKFILSRFKIYWFPSNKNLAAKSKELKDKLKPRCNLEGILPKDFKIED